MHCACHAKGSRGPSGGHARRSSSRRLSALRLPHERQPRPQRRQPAAAACPGGSVYCTCHTKGSRGPRGGHARRSSSGTPCVLRLPRDRQPRPAAILEKKKAFKRSYCLYFKGERESSNGATASILEEKGAFKQRYCLYFRGERESSNGATASILEEKGVSNRATGEGSFKQSYCLYF